MTLLAVSGVAAVFAIIGLVVGLVVLGVVIALLQMTLTPLRKTLADVQLAHTAPMLERGVPGTEQLGQTRRLAEMVPPLALAYLQKLGAGGSPRPAAPQAPQAPPPGSGHSGGMWIPPPGGQTPDNQASNLPAWQRYSG